jgi:hypothetical protein
MLPDIYARFTPLAPFFTAFLQAVAYSLHLDGGSCRARFV